MVCHLSRIDQITIILSMFVCTISLSCQNEVYNSHITGSDFTGSVQTITFVSGVDTENILVFIIDDEEYEGIEEFYATLTTVDVEIVEIFEPDATITIIDDGKVYKKVCTLRYYSNASSDVTVFFEEDSYTVLESESFVEVCVRREGDVSQRLTIHVWTQEFIPPQAQGIL